MERIRCMVSGRVHNVALVCQKWRIIFPLHVRRSPFFVNVTKSLNHVISKYKVIYRSKTYSRFEQCSQKFGIFFVNLFNNITHPANTCMFKFDNKNMSFAAVNEFKSNDNLKRYQDPVRHLTRHKQWNFPLRISSVNVTKSAGNCGFGHIYFRNP